MKCEIPQIEISPPTHTHTHTLTLFQPTLIQIRRALISGQFSRLTSSFKAQSHLDTGQQNYTCNLCERRCLTDNKLSAATGSLKQILALAQMKSFYLGKGNQSPSRAVLMRSAEFSGELRRPCYYIRKVVLEIPNTLPTGSGEGETGFLFMP